MRLPDATSHSRTVSSLALAIVFPSGLNVTLLNSHIYPHISVPMQASQSRTVLSSLALATVFPSGLNATLKTSSLCPVRVCMRISRAGVPEPDGLITTPHLQGCFHPGLNDTLLTQPVCPVRVCLRGPVWASQSRTVFITTPTCNSVSIGTKRHASDIIRMPGERVYEPGAGIPQPDSFIPTCSCDSVSIGTKYAIDLIPIGEGVYEDFPGGHPTAGWSYHDSHLQQCFHRD